MDDFSSRAALVGKGDRVSYIDTRGSLLDDFRWEDGFPFQGELAVVIQDGLEGVINKAGGEVLPAEFDRIRLRETGPILTEKGGLYRYYSRRGKPLFEPFEKAELFRGDSVAVVVANGKAQLIDREGRSLLSGDFTDLKPRGESMLAVKDSTGEWALPDYRATPLSTKRYDEVGEMSDSLAAVRV